MQIMDIFCHIKSIRQIVTARWLQTSISAFSGQFTRSRWEHISKVVYGWWTDNGVPLAVTMIPEESRDCESLFVVTEELQLPKSSTATIVVPKNFKSAILRQLIKAIFLKIKVVVFLIKCTATFLNLLLSL